MISLFFIVTILLYGAVMSGFVYCAVKMYRLPHLPRRWGFYLSAPNFAIAFYLLVLLVTAPFAARPSYVVLWTAIARLAALVVLGGGVGFLSFFFLRTINGNHSGTMKDKEPNDPISGQH